MEIITALEVFDVRFPTSLEHHGSDAMHTDPDYSCAYVVLETNTDEHGYGLTFTCGRGTEVICAAIKAYAPFVIGRDVPKLLTGAGFGSFWRDLAYDSQLRWLGPEKGVIHLALGAITNAVWDLWARKAKKPLWRLLADMLPEELVATLDFRYIEDALTHDEALAILNRGHVYKVEREANLLQTGIPAYVTSAGWLGYTDEQIAQKCRDALENGFHFFKMKVGRNLEADKERVALIRREIGPNNLLAIDANQIWGLSEAIGWVRQLASFHPVWIEEPTSADDVIGHATVAESVRPLGIGVATGEYCQNQILFKQLFQLKAVDYAQADSCRLGGVSENLAVFLMAVKFGVPICPHAGGVGLCEMVQHLSAYYHLCLASPQILAQGAAVTEYVDNLHEHFINPAVVKNGHYQLPVAPGYSTEIRRRSVENYQYPTGSVWQQLFASGKYTAPQ